MRQPDWDTVRARQLLEEGQSDLQVAEAVGTSLTAIRSWKQRNGLVRPRAPRQRTDRTPEVVTQDAASEEEDRDEQDLEPPAAQKLDKKNTGRAVPVQCRLHLGGCEICINAPDIASAQRVLGLLPGIDDDC